MNSLVSNLRGLLTAILIPVFCVSFFAPGNIAQAQLKLDVSTDIPLSDDDTFGGLFFGDVIIELEDADDGVDVTISNFRGFRFNPKAPGITFDVKASMGGTLLPDDVIAQYNLDPDTIDWNLFEGSMNDKTYAYLDHTVFKVTGQKVGMPPASLKGDSVSAEISSLPIVELKKNIKDFVDDPDVGTDHYGFQVEFSISEDAGPSEGDHFVRVSAGWASSGDDVEFIGEHNVGEKTSNGVLAFLVSDGDSSVPLEPVTFRGKFTLELWFDEDDDNLVDAGEIIASDEVVLEKK